MLCYVCLLCVPVICQSISYLFESLFSKCLNKSFQKKILRFGVLTSTKSVCQDILTWQLFNIYTIYKWLVWIIQIDGYLIFYCTIMVNISKINTFIYPVWFARFKSFNFNGPLLLL